jgi:hypothetical protein
MLKVSDGDSGLYRVRAVNALGEAECEAELLFEGRDGAAPGGGELYLPPLWRERKRLTWKDEDQRKKPFVGFKARINYNINLNLLTYGNLYTNFFLSSVT